MKRGKVIRDANLGPGLLMIDGQQYSFALEGVWKSEAAPKIGTAVEVDFDAQGQIAAITAVPQSQIAKQAGFDALGVAKTQGVSMLGPIVEKAGRNNLIAAGVIL